jgi:hypothetical protein
MITTELACKALAHGAASGAATCLLAPLVKTTAFSAVATAIGTLGFIPVCLLAAGGSAISQVATQVLLPIVHKYSVKEQDGCGANRTNFNGSEIVDYSATRTKIVHNILTSTSTAIKIASITIGAGTLGGSAVAGGPALALAVTIHIATTTLLARF